MTKPGYKLTEEQRARRRAGYYANREKRLAWQKEYDAAHVEQRREREARYREQRRAERLAEEKRLRGRYAGECQFCGAITHGSGPDKIPITCARPACQSRIRRGRSPKLAQ